MNSSSTSITPVIEESKWTPLVHNGRPIGYIVNKAPQGGNLGGQTNPAFLSMKGGEGVRPEEEQIG